MTSLVSHMTCFMVIPHPQCSVPFRSAREGISYLKESITDPFQDALHALTNLSTDVTLADVRRQIATTTTCFITCLYIVE